MLDSEDEDGRVRSKSVLCWLRGEGLEPETGWARLFNQIEVPVRFGNGTLEVEVDAEPDTHCGWRIAW